jgi:hypothetical protein
MVTRWLGVILAGAVVSASACGDEGEQPMGPGAGGEAELGGAGGSSAGTAEGGTAEGGTAEGGTGASPRGDGGQATAGAPDMAQGGAGAPTFGGAGGDGASGAGAGSGGDTNLPNLEACPAVGQTFTVTELSSSEDIALAQTLGCDVLDEAHLSFEVTRFQVNAPSISVIWSPHSLIDTYDSFALVTDCGTTGLMVPPYVRYPGTLLSTLGAGIHTRVTCAANIASVVESAPAAATNVDCAHALPLPQTATRVPEPSRFFNLNLAADAAEVAIALTTAHTNSGALGKLTRLSPAFEATAELPYLIDSLRFEDVPSGSYCLEIAADPGISYAIDVDYIDYL